MELVTIIIGVLVLLLCGLPFVIIRRNRRKREQQFLEALAGLAEKSNSKISEFDLWNNTSIGIDKNTLTLFYLRKAEHNDVERTIKLSDTRSCRVIKTNRTINNKDDNFAVIYKLELGFEFYAKDKPETTLEFYNAEHDSLTLRGELQLIEKWSSFVNNTMANRTTISSDR